jgi:hypothetical protein
VSGDSGSSQSSCIIFWAPDGAAIGMIEAPHAAGVAAFSWATGSAQGAAPLLVTLSAAAAGTPQEVAIWDCASVWAVLRGETDAEASPVLLASASLPSGSAPAASLASATGPSALLGKTGPLGTAIAEAAVTQLNADVPCAPTSIARVTNSFELLSCADESAPAGSGSRVTFFSVVCVAISQRRAAGAGSAIETVEYPAWHIAASPGALPRDTNLAHAVSTSAAFFDGARAARLTENDSIAAGIGAVKLPGGPLGKTAVGGVPGEGATLLVRASVAGVVAMAGTAEGSLLEWVNVAAPLSVGASLPPKESLSDTTLALSRKVALKAVSLKRPEILNLAHKAPAGYGAGGSSAPAPRPSYAVTALEPTPSGRSLLVGTADGAVRLYDLHCRLVAAWEDLSAGAVTRLSLAPAGTPRSGPPPPVSCDPATRAALADCPDFVVTTQRALAIAVAADSFGAPPGDEGDAARAGSIIFEGPDSAIVGVAAVPSPRGAPVPAAPLLAVAVASGSVQLWAAASSPGVAGDLLLVRDLGRHAPSVLAVDALGRYMAVGTTEGWLLVLDARTLADAQAPIKPPKFDAPLAQGGGVPGARIERLCFSADGLHLAAGDAAGYVSLYRFSRLVERVPAPNASTAAASARLLARRPWDTLGDASSGGRWVERSTLAWAFVGRVKAHAPPLAGLSFSAALPRADAVAALAGSACAGAPLPASVSAAAVGGSAPEPGDASAPFWSFEESAEMPLSPVDAAALVTARHAAAGLCLLASIGADKRAVIFDVGGSSAKHGLVPRPAAIDGVDSGPQASRVSIEQLATPCSLTWLPPLRAIEDIKASGAPPALSSIGSLLIANDAYKMRVWDTTASDNSVLKCLRTSLGPTFGGAVTAMELLPSAASVARVSAAAAASLEGGGAPHPSSASPRDRGRSRASSGGSSSSRMRNVSSAATEPDALSFVAIVYATDDRVVGVAALPVDGSPHGVLGVVAACGPVTALAVAAPVPGSTRSAFFTADGASVTGWAIDEGALRRVATGPGGDPYVSALSGGFGGEQHTDLCDTFTYAQIHSQGEASAAPRGVTSGLPLAQLPTLMRGLGFYPTVWEEELLVAEAAAGCRAKAEANGTETRLEVDSADAIRLFVNHRPVREPTRDDVLEAMSALVPGGEIKWSTLVSRLMSQGETLSHADVSAISATLAGGDEVAGAALLVRALANATDNYSPDAPVPSALLTAALATHTNGMKVAALTARAPLPEIPDGPIHDDDILSAHDVASILSL